MKTQKQHEDHEHGPAVTQDELLRTLTLAHHKRVLQYLNAAASPHDLMELPARPMSAEQMMGMSHGGGAAPAIHKPVKLMEADVAHAIFELRHREFPLGFTHINQLAALRIDIRRLLQWFSNMNFGSWQTLPYNIPRPGGGGVNIVHAALLYTDRVLFLDDGHTPIWDYNDEVNPQFEFPVTNPTYSLTCSGHSFLSNGHLLVVGGGGFGPIAGANKGFRFDPVAKRWTKTAGDMAKVRWYPTAVSTGENRMLVVGGWDANAQVQTDVEVYDEGSDAFATVNGAVRSFANLYPGLHLLPNNTLFYTRTGWGSAGSGSPAANDGSAYCQFPGPTMGSWSAIAPSVLNRCKGMSVILYRNTCPHTRILVVGGCESNGTGLSAAAEIIDVSLLSPASAWALTAPLPDVSPRRQCNAVLLPDGTVFVAGGVITNNSPCMLFDPVTDSWSLMADLPSIRMYHSVMILLPNGKVMMSGWANDASSGTIELFSPPYLFKGARPTIASAPATVNFGQQFTIGTPDATAITRVTLVRPMAVTHQTETNQRVVELYFLHDHVHPNNLIVTAPEGGSPHAFVPRGYYMLFILNSSGVPSVAKWIRVQ